MAEKRKAAPGWYPHPSMADTRRYWDGEKWTDQVAPMDQGQPAGRSGPGVLTIARGVALGVAAVLCVLFVLHSCQEESALDCSLRNAERAEQGLPPVDCPE